MEKVDLSTSLFINPNPSQQTASKDLGKYTEKMCETDAVSVQVKVNNVWTGIRFGDMVALLSAVGLIT